MSSFNFYFWGPLLENKLKAIWTVKKVFHKHANFTYRMLNVIERPDYGHLGYICVSGSHPWCFLDKIDDIFDEVEGRLFDSDDGYYGPGVLKKYTPITLEITPHKCTKRSPLCVTEDEIDEIDQWEECFCYEVRETTFEQYAMKNIDNVVEGHNAHRDKITQWPQP